MLDTVAILPPWCASMSRPNGGVIVSTTMKQKIVGYHQDEMSDWVADLACGHTQHIRHTPPLSHRPWVLHEEGRQRFLGYELDCKICDGDDIRAIPS